MDSTIIDHISSNWVLRVSCFVFIHKWTRVIYVPYYSSSSIRRKGQAKSEHKTWQAWIIRCYKSTMMYTGTAFNCRWHSKKNIPNIIYQRQKYSSTSIFICSSRYSVRLFFHSLLLSPPANRNEYTLCHFISMNSPLVILLYTRAHVHFTAFDKEPMVSAFRKCCSRAKGKKKEKNIQHSFHSCQWHYKFVTNFVCVSWRLWLW